MCQVSEDNNGSLLIELNRGDVVAQELKYHPDCLVKLYTHQRTLQEEQSDHGSLGKGSYPQGFSELVTYTMEVKPSSDDTTFTIFMFAYLEKLYKNVLE